MFLVLCIMFSALLIRIAYIENEPDVGTAVNATETYVKIGSKRGYIYDRNMVPLVNNRSGNVSVIISSEKTLELLADAGNDSVYNAENGILISKITEKEIEETDMSVNIKLIERYSSDTLLRHIIGYTDYNGKGVCGVEKSFDAILNSAGGTVGVSYNRNALGKALLGTSLKIENDGYDSKAGLVLTVDSEIQAIAQNALKMSDIIKGACVIINVNTGEIEAIASIPEYDINNLDESLTDENLPFLNRALNSYPVGSVFKPFVAVAAIESGVNVNGNFKCNGYYETDGTVFNCYNKKSHEDEQLNDAVCNSCNCYFIDLGLKTGGKKLCETAALFGFGKEIALTSDIICDGGNLPDEKTLTSNAALANFSFGQGDLLAAPLQLAAAYAALASGGVYREPYITKALVDENGEEYAYFEPSASVNIVDEGVCNVINESLRLNMLEGTGKNGAVDNVSCAGKTATAQTGKYDENGNEILCTWFCGFFPFENPRYSVCVFNEDGTSASGDCAPVFGEIVKEISALK